MNPLHKGRELLKYLPSAGGWPLTQNAPVHSLDADLRGGGKSMSTRFFLGAVPIVYPTRLPRRAYCGLITLLLTLSACQAPIHPGSQPNGPEITPVQQPAGEFTPGERSTIIAQPNAPYDVILLTQNQSTQKLLDQIRDARGKIRAVDVRSGIIVATVDGHFAREFEALNRNLGRNALVSSMSLSKAFTYSFAEESLNPLTGQDNVAKQVIVDPSPNNHQLPTEEMELSAFRDYVQNKYGFSPNGDSVKLAILDTGVDLAHRDVFQDRIISSWDMTPEGQVLMTAGTLDGEKKLVTWSHEDSKKSVQLQLNTETLKEAQEFYLGHWHEASYYNKDEDDVVDINQDGKLDSVFAVLLIKGPEGYRAAIDRNQNGDFADETFVGNYEDRHETIIMDQAGKGVVRVNINIPTHDDGSLKKESNDQVILNIAGFDSGRHGTHVAGIAAGNFQAPQFGESFKGGAPLAQIISVKVLRADGGRNSDLVAGMILAAEKGAQVINMSLSVSRSNRSSASDGSDIVSQSVDRMIRARQISFTIGAGNEGPGVLSVSPPGTAKLAITVGAAVTGATLKKAYNIRDAAEGHYLWSFSGVGPSDINHGKPTLVAPGSAYSSVPLAKNRLDPSADAVYDVKQGTSMAAPATAGVVAAILDAVTKINRHSETPVMPSDPRNFELALIDGAVDLNLTNSTNQTTPRYHRIEQGAGHLSALRAFVALEARTPEPAPEYVVKTKSWSTHYDKPAAGIFTTRPLPKDLRFQIAKLEDGRNDVDFYRVLNVQSTAEWITVDTPTIALTATNQSDLEVSVNQDIMRNLPEGLHEAQLILRNSRNGQLEQQIDITYLKAHEITQIEGNSQFTEPQVKLLPGEVKRYYFYIPQERTGLSFTLEQPRYAADGRDSPAAYRLYVIGPKGTTLFTSPGYINQRLPIHRLDLTNPAPGIYEVAVFRSPKVEETVAPSLSLTTTSVALDPRAWVSRVGDKPISLVERFRVTNYSNTISPKVEGKITKIGFAQPQVALQSGRTSEITLTVPPGVSQVHIKTTQIPDMPDADIDIVLYDGKGKRLDESNGPTAQESVSASVQAGDKLVLHLNIYQMSEQSGAINVQWSFELKEAVPVKGRLAEEELEWGRSTELLAEIQFDPALYQDLLADLKRFARPLHFNGAIELSTSEIDTTDPLRIQSIPIVLGVAP